MNDIGMTSKEIKNRIAKEERYLKSCQMKLLNIRSDINATERCIKFWNKHLKKVEKKEQKENK